MPNAKLLHETLDAIAGNTVRWDQMSWNHCFAGIACRLSGHTVVKGMTWKPFYALWRMGPVWAAAQRELGLSTWEATRLFEGINRYGELARLVDVYAPERTIP